MTALRSRRLEALFGVQLDDLTGEHIRRLVANAVPEEFDLDYKQATYGGSDADKRSLRVDVAALANTAGGVIIIGVAEDQQARAMETPGVDLTDAEVGRMRTILGGGLSPMPTLDIVQVPDSPNDPTHGFYVLAVPRSPAAPHAVLVDTSLRYPRRNGATTRYLSEPEVAAAYRDRTAGMARVQKRITEIENSPLAAGKLDGPWVKVSLVPDLPGDLLLTTQAAEAFQQEVAGRRVWLNNGGHQFMRTTVGRRQLLADAGTESGMVSYAFLRVFTDGSGIFGTQIPDMEAGMHTLLPNTPSPEYNRVADESIVLAIMSGLLWLGRHAVRRCATGGNATARAWLMPDYRISRLALAQMRMRFGWDKDPVVWDRQEPAETTVDLADLVAPSPGLAVATAALGNEIAQSLGVAELSLWTSEGLLDASKWSQDQQRPMTVWAESNGIGVAGVPKQG